MKDKIRKWKEEDEKIEECVNLMSEIKKELKEIKRNVGSKVEDVKGMIE